MSHQPLVRTKIRNSLQRAFDDVDRGFTPAVAVVDANGDQTGTSRNPLATTSDSAEVLTNILEQLCVLNRHMAEINGEAFTLEDCT